MSYYLSLHLVFIYYAVESQLASLSDPVWVTYFRGRPELWFMQSTTDVVNFRKTKEGLKVRLRELFWQVSKKEPDLISVGRGPR